MSLCDLVDRNLEFVLDVHSSLVYWRHNSKPLWWNLCLTVSSLFFFTRVCEHLALLVHGKRRKFSVLNFFSVIVEVIAKLVNSKAIARACVVLELEQVRD
jgi:hypothetical protein